HGYQRNCETHCHCHTLLSRSGANVSACAATRLAETHWHSMDYDCKSHGCPPTHSADIVQMSCTDNPNTHYLCLTRSPRTKARIWHLPAADERTCKQAQDRQQTLIASLWPQYSLKAVPLRCACGANAQGARQYLRRHGLQQLPYREFSSG